LSFELGAPSFENRESRFELPRACRFELWDSNFELRASSSELRAELRASSSELRASSFELRPPSAELRASSCELRTSVFELPASSFELRASALSFELQASSFDRRASSSELRASSFKLRASSFELRASSFELGTEADHSKTEPARNINRTGPTPKRSLAERELDRGGCLTRNLPTIVGPGPNLSRHNPDKRRGKATPGRSGAGPVRTRIEVARISQQPWSTRNRTIPNPNPDPIKPNRIRFDPEPDRSRVKKTTNLIVRHRN
jgi:hypothetical protein